MELGGFVLAAIVVMTAYAAFQQWLRQQRRLMVHRERLAALEKGVELPALEQGVQRRSRSIQRFLLFAGLIWVSLGIGTYLVLNALVGQSFQFLWGQDRFGNLIWITVHVRDGMQWIGAALFGIGVSHLIVYAVGKKGEE
jgi:hypothetical protein